MSFPSQDGNSKLQGGIWGFGIFDGGVVVAVQGLNGLDEVVGGPGVGVQVQVLVSAGLLEGVQVDGHAVGGHDQGVLVDGAVGVGAGVHHALVDGVDLGCGSQAR